MEGLFMLKIIGKKPFIMYILFLVLFAGTIGFIIGQHITYESRELIFYSPQTIKTMNNRSELPLPKSSDITVEQNNVRLDLEKIAIKKYFIVYSAIYGNQSHTAYHLFLTNLSKNKIDQNQIKNIWLETKNGNRIEPVAQKPIIRDFPVDQPLGWRIKIIVKFPYQTQRKNHKLVLQYKNSLYKLNDIKY